MSIDGERRIGHVRPQNAVNCQPGRCQFRQRSLLECWREAGRQEQSVLVA
jgi:hypothetical protein